LPLERLSEPANAVDLQHPMTTTIARKTLMALTGLFLCFFLIVHLLGNLQLFLPDDQAQTQFNWYAETLSSLLVIEIAAMGTYLAILAHTVLAIVLTVRNRRTAGDRYQAKSPVPDAPWYSRFMGVLGAVILLFLIVHMKDFWYPFKTGADIGLDAAGRRDLFGLVATEFQQVWRIVLYEAGVLALGFHLLHGFYSGCRSLGLHQAGYARAVRWLGAAFAVVITLGFGAMPLYLFFTQ
jgi:succinate dehydrogenase / fumarate reductase cytochrome b subunit